MMFDPKHVLYLLKNEFKKHRVAHQSHCLFVFKVMGLRREFILFKIERTIRYLGNVHTLFLCQRSF